MAFEGGALHIASQWLAGSHSFDNPGRTPLNCIPTSRPHVPIRDFFMLSIPSLVPCKTIFLLIMFLPVSCQRILSSFVPSPRSDDSCMMTKASTSTSKVSVDWLVPDFPMKSRFVVWYVSTRLSMTAAAWGSSSSGEDLSLLVIRLVTYHLRWTENCDTALCAVTG